MPLNVKIFGESLQSQLYIIRNEMHHMQNNPIQMLPPNNAQI